MISNPTARRFLAGESGDRLASIGIVVIGGSAGSIESLKKVVTQLAGGFSRLTLRGGARFTIPCDEESIRIGHINVARADRYLTTEGGEVRILRG